MKNPSYLIRSNWDFLLGTALGAFVMFWSDPRRGRRRRALVRDKVHHYKKVGGRRLNSSLKDLENRGHGLLASSRARLRRESVTEDVLVARVASALGRVVAHPHSIGVTADEGKVILSGSVFERELPRLLSAVRKVPGVRAVEHHFERKVA